MILPFIPLSYWLQRKALTACVLVALSRLNVRNVLFAHSGHLIACSQLYAKRWHCYHHAVQISESAWP